MRRQGLLYDTKSDGSSRDEANGDKSSQGEGAEEFVELIFLTGRT